MQILIHSRYQCDSTTSFWKHTVLNVKKGNKVKKAREIILTLEKFLVSYDSAFINVNLILKFMMR